MLLSTSTLGSIISMLITSVTIILEFAISMSTIAFFPDMKSYSQASARYKVIIVSFYGEMLSDLLNLLPALYM